MNGNSSLLSRLGLGAAILALIAFLIPVGAMLLGVFGVVQMNSDNDINNLLTGAVIVGIIALALAVLAVLLNLPGLFSDPRRGVVTLIGSVLLLLLSAGFLFGMALPRAAAVQNLKDNVIPFGQAMSDGCKAPLNATIADLTKMRDFADSTKTSDTGYASGAGAYITALHGDDAKMVDGIQAVQAATVPDPKYQTLKDECLKSLRGLEGFLANPAANPVIPPFDALLGKTISGFTLLDTSVALAAGKVPLPTPLPAGTAQALVSGALTQVITTKNDALTKAGDDLTKDIKDGLTNNLAPFKVNVPVG
jgi:hypothetical protein